LWITPDQWLKKEDPQLAKAIDLLREKPVNKNE